MKNPSPVPTASGTKVILFFPVGVAAVVLAAIGLILVFPPSWSFNFDLGCLQIVDYSHPHYSPPEDTEDETYGWISVTGLLKAPEMVFAIEPEESNEVAARRLMPICRQIWLVRPRDKAEFHSMLGEWLDQVAATHSAYGRDYGAADAALRAQPAGDPAEWTDATPGGRYRYLMARLQLSLLERVLAGKWDLTELEDPIDDERVGKAYTRFLFEWK